LPADPLALNDAIMDLRAYSLLDRDPDEQTITVHRLVQPFCATACPEPNNVPG